MNIEIEKAIEQLKSLKEICLYCEDGHEPPLVAIELSKVYDLAITALESQQADMWIPISSGELPGCEYGCESKQVLYQLKNTGTIETGYFGCGGKIRDKYFRHLRDSSEGVDISDVIAWKYANPYNEVHQ